MLPNSGNQSSPQKKPHTFFLPKYSFNSIKSQSALRYTGWLFIAIFLQALIVVLLIRGSSRFPVASLTQRLPRSRDKECKNGRVFVYDLPPLFNKKLLENCHDLDPWKSKCDAVSNGGFGPKAINLDGVVPENVRPAWYWTHMYSGEVIYHVRMLNYKCRTMDPQQATAFYVPFYAGLAVGKYLWYNYTSKERDQHSEMMLNWLKDQPSWKKQNGTDHFIMLGRLTWDFRRLMDKDSEWGTSFIHMPLMKNVVKLSLERNIWDELEFSVPYPSPFHPRSDSDIIEWQRYIRSIDRHTLFCYVGATRVKIKNDFKALLLNYCKSQSGSCKLVDCALVDCTDGTPLFLEAFLDSDFCLQPRGDGYTRRALFDCMSAGSIPVFFWEKSFQGQFEWHLPLNAESYSVFIDNKEVRNGTVSIKSKLEGYSKEEIRKMRETVIDLLPRVVYGSNDLGNIKDAFEITVDSILQKFHSQNLRQKESLP